MSEIKFLSIEGGGAGGLAVHPGALRALQDLGILDNSSGRQVSIEGFAGSSSGSLLATLGSVGYNADEITELLSPDAIDFVFSFEELAVGELTALGMSHHQSSAVSSGYSDIYESKRLKTTMSREIPKSYSRAEYLSGLKNVTNEFGYLIHHMADYGLDVKRKDVAASIALLFLALPNLLPRHPSALGDVAVSVQKLNDMLPGGAMNLLDILASDYGFYSGAPWRDYVDAMIAFALFRVNEGLELPNLGLPRIKPGVANSPYLLFIDHIMERWFEARNFEGWTPVREQAEYERLYESYCLCTFAQHSSLIYAWVLDTSAPPPLTITGANLTVQESHVFSAETTPGFLVADAVRLATSLPPLFKPVLIEEQDVRSDWPSELDRFGRQPYIQGLWIDGGLYANSPLDYFLPYESSGRRALGLGMGLEDTVRDLGSLSKFYVALINSAYERVVSATRVDLDYFINYDNFDISLWAPKPSNDQIELYQQDAYDRTIQKVATLGVASSSWPTE